VAGRAGSALSFLPSALVERRSGVEGIPRRPV